MLLHQLKLTVIFNAEDNKRALVVVPDNKLSLAIGRRGQNVRLAAHLTGYRIDIKSASEFEAMEAATNWAALEKWQRKLSRKMMQI